MSGHVKLTLGPFAANPVTRLKLLQYINTAPSIPPAVRIALLARLVHHQSLREAAFGRGISHVCVTRWEHRVLERFNRPT